MKKARFVLIIFLSSFLMLTLPLFVHPVSAYPLQTSFVGAGSLGGNVSLSWMVTQPHNGTDDFYIDNSPTKDGDSRSFFWDGGHGYWNYTYSSTLAITNWSIHYLHNTNPDYEAQEHLDFKNTDGDIVIQLDLNYDRSNFMAYYRDFEGNWQTITGGAGSPLDTWTTLSFEFVDNDTVNYYLKESTGTVHNLLSKTPRNVLDDYGIRSVHFYSPGANNPLMNFDLHNITIGDIEIDDTEVSVIPGYEVIGTVNCGNYLNSNAFYLETRYDVYLTGEIKAIDLLVDNQLIDGWSLTADDFEMKLNGDTYIASSVIEYGGNYILRWYFDTPISIVNVRPLLEFSSRPSGITWKMAYCNCDTDGDGDQYYVNHNQATFYDGELTQLSPVAYDLCYRIHGLFSSVTPSQPDDIFISTENGTTCDIYDPIMVGCTVSTRTPQNYIYVYDDSWNLVKTHLVDGWDDSFEYRPTSVGTFTFNLSRNSVVLDSESITVYNANIDYLIYTDPDPSNPGGSFKIYYIYDDATYQGRIYILDSVLNVIDLFGVTQSATLTSTSYSLDDEGLYHFRLYSILNQSTLEKQLQDTDTHWVGATNYKNQVLCPESVQVDTSIDIYGSHNFRGHNVYVEIGGVEMVYVGDTSEFDLQYIPVKARFYNVSLILETADGTRILLDWDGFTAKQPDDWYQETESPIPLIPAWLGAILGTITTACFLFLPVYVGSKYHKNIPYPVYAMSGGIGMVFSVLLGFFGMWVPFFLIAVGVIVAVIFFGQKRSGGSE